MIYLFLILSFFSLTFGGQDENVFIEGEIGSQFNESHVSVIDSFGQTYKLPRSAFPSDQKFEQGQTFALEYPIVEMEKIKIKKAKKR